MKSKCYFKPGDPRYLPATMVELEIAAARVNREIAAWAQLDRKHHLSLTPETWRTKIERSAGHHALTASIEATIARTGSGE